MNFFILFCHCDCGALDLSYVLDLVYLLVFIASDLIYKYSVSFCVFYLSFINCGFGSFSSQFLFIGVCLDREKMKENNRLLRFYFFLKIFSFGLKNRRFNFLFRCGFFYLLNAEMAFFFMLIKTF